MEIRDGLVLVNHRLGPQCLNQTRERAGGFLTMNMDTSNTAPSCHIIQTQVQADRAPNRARKGAKPRPRATKTELGTQSQGAIAVQLSCTPAQAPPRGPSSCWSLKPVPVGGHGTCVTKPFSADLPPGRLLPQASSFPGLLPSFAQFSKRRMYYTASKTGVSKQGHKIDTSRQTKANLVYDHQTLIRGTSKG